MRLATTDEINHLVNRPDISTAFGVPEDSYLDMSGFYDNQGNVALRSPVGCMLFPKIGHGVYDSHFLFMPGHMGWLIKKCASAMLDTMFTYYGASAIRGSIPRDFRAVRTMAYALGYKQTPDTPFKDGMGRECVTYEIRREQWEI